MFVFLHFDYFVGLVFCGAIVMDNANAAAELFRTMSLYLYIYFTFVLKAYRHSDCHICFSDGIHGRGHKRCLKSDPFRQARAKDHIVGREINVTGQYDEVAITNTNKQIQIKNSKSKNEISMTPFLSNL